MSQETLALAIFIVTYALVVAERPHRTLAALLGAGAMILTGILHQAEAVRSIDFNTIGLLAGMMLLVHALQRTGAFEWLAVVIVRKTHGQPGTILLGFFAMTAVASAFLDNVTTVLLVCPLTFLIADRLDIDPMPWVLAEIVASNIGGTATLIGDPPNIMIGSAVGLDFLAFLEHLGPIALVTGLVIAFTLRIAYRRSLKATGAMREVADGLAPPPLKADRRTLYVCLGVMGAVVVGFLLHGPLGLEAATIALGGATILLVLTKDDLHESLAAIEWPTLFFFVGLFVVVGGVEKVGLLEKFGGWLLAVTRGNLALAAIGFLWGAAFISAVVDNIPATAALIPVVKAMAASIHPGVEHPWAHPDILPLWWALALGACLGGNGTIVGASANVVVAGLAERAGRPISFVRFLRVGIPVTIASLLLSTAYLFLRYLL
jgi:Na+/H+ antiporter NhaD/arsenite permease-like protein